MSKPKWWTQAFEHTKNPLEKFQYLTGLSELSWADCCDAWFESKKLIPEVAKEIAALKAEVKSLEANRER